MTVMVFALSGCGADKKEVTNEVGSTDVQQQEEPSDVEGEPKATGDGMAVKTDVLRLMKFHRTKKDEEGIKLTYEEMVQIVGVEGEDLGNSGPNSMTEYGDHIIRWYAEEKMLM